MDKKKDDIELKHYLKSIKEELWKWVDNECQYILNNQKTYSLSPSEITALQQIRLNIRKVIRIFQNNGKVIDEEINALEKVINKLIRFCLDMEKAKEKGETDNIERIKNAIREYMNQEYRKKNDSNSMNGGSANSGHVEKGSTNSGHYDEIR